MNRALIITIGIIIIILVLGVWVYLMLFGTPEKSSEVFANLGFQIAQQDTTIAPPVVSDGLPDTTIDIQSDALRQLTTRPIAGFTFASTSLGQAVRYVERGTGHVYEINLETGIESQVSRTTVPQVTSAVFAPGGNTVALSASSNYKTSVFVGTFGDATNLVGIQLQPNAENISFASDSEVLYTVSSQNSTRGYIHNIDTLTQSERFTFNYANLDVSWGNGLNKTYLATKPAHDFEGFIYSTQNNILTPEMPSAYGLSGLITNNVILATFIQDRQYNSAVISSNGGVSKLPLLALKEKCVFDVFNENYLWCAAPLSDPGTTFVEDWYKGVATSVDHLWLINTSKGEAELYASPEALTGRIMDVSAISINTTGDSLLMTNKLDHTLWMYDLLKEVN